MKLTVAILIAAAMAVAGGSAASAATVNLETTTGHPLSSNVETFDGSSLSGITIQLNGGAAVVSGSSSGNYAAPFVNTPYLNHVSSGPDDTNYLSVYGGSSATFTLSQPANYLGFLWGSVDTYNSIQFLGAGDVVLATFTGSDFLVHNGDQSAAGTYYANFTSDTPFLKVVLSSAKNSFEIDDVSISTVPLPAALPLFGAALAGMGVFGRKRRKAQVAA